MENIKEELIYWSKRLYQKDLAPATSGNISAREHDKIFISRSGVCLNDMETADIVEMDLDANPINTKFKPSTEKYLHLLIYEKREDINAIIHSHSPYITAFAVSHKDIKQSFSPDFTYYFNKIELAPYYLPGSLELAQETAKFFDKSDCVLMANHGVVIGANSIKECFYKLEALNAHAQTYFAAEILGGAKNFNKKQIEEIKKIKK